MLKRVLLFFMVCSSLASWAEENGWELLIQNEHHKAKEVFQKELESDSTNLHALQGMVVLSELVQDKLSKQKFINKLIKLDSTGYYYLLFKDDYNGEPQEIIDKNYPSYIKIHTAFEQASDLKQERSFTRSKEAYAKLVNDFAWSFIGPFKNVCGSGYKNVHDVELDAFDSSKTYVNYKGLELKWVTPLYTNDQQRFNLGDYLPSSYGKSVYYASCTFNLIKDSTIELRLARSAPVKVWVDNKLVYSDSNATRYLLDNEIIGLQLSKGSHRVLLKLADPQDSPKRYNLLDEKSFYSYSFWDYTSSYSSSHYLYSQNDVFSLRITNRNGITVRKANSESAKGNANNSKPFMPRIERNHLLKYLKGESDFSNDPFSYYALCKAYIEAGRSREAEERFVKHFRMNDKSVYFQYLLSLLYAENGKIEAVYNTLKDVDHDRSPVFGLLFEKLNDIDMENDEQKFLEALDRLKNISPSNKAVINSYFKYYDKKGLLKEKEEYISELKKLYPAYALWLDEELKDENKPNKTRTKREEKKDIAETLKRMKTRFYSYDYSKAIEHYKSKANEKKVMSLYDELLSHIPSSVSYRKAKARYLYSEEKYDEALNELNVLLSIAPYNNATLEMIGDIYYDIDKKVDSTQSRALHYYLLAKKYASYDYTLDSKIEKIQGKQSYKKLFNTISFEDILSDTGWVDKYADEESVILMFTRDLIFDSTRHVEVYQQLAIKVLTEAGAKRWTEYSFSFMGNLKNVKVLKPDGSEMTPDKSGSYVVFKNLEPQDVILIDGSYRWKQQREFENDLSITHYLSFDVPTYYAKYEAAVPAGTHMSYIYHHLDDVAVKKEGEKYDFYKWEYNHIPKIEKESATPDSYDRFASITISTMKDWSEVVEWYDQTTYRKLEPTYEVKAALDSIILPSMSSEEKVERIYNYLTQEIKYSYVHFLQSGYVPKDPALTLSSGIGDCKDVASLMIVMLREVGIEAYYALVKTNSFNHLNMLPSQNFDHVVVYYSTGSEEGFLDMTTDYYPYYVLTGNDIDAWALLIKDGEKDIFKLPQDDLDTLKNMVSYEIDATIGTNNRMELEVKATYKGMEGGQMRELFTSLSESERKNYLIKSFGKGSFKSLSFDEFKFENLSEISEPLRAYYKISAEEYTDNVANIIISNIPYLNAISSNPILSSSTRHNRLNLGRVLDVEPSKQHISIKFPDGYRLVELPEDISIDNKFGSYTVKFKKTPSGMEVYKKQVYKKRILQVDEYVEFKEHYMRLLKYDKAKIALQSKLKNG